MQDLSPIMKAFFKNADKLKSVDKYWDSIFHAQSSITTIERDQDGLSVEELLAESNNREPEIEQDVEHDVEPEIEHDDINVDKHSWDSTKAVLLESSIINKVNNSEELDDCMQVGETLKAPSASAISAKRFADSTPDVAEYSVHDDTPKVKHHGPPNNSSQSKGRGSANILFAHLRHKVMGAVLLAFSLFPVTSAGKWRQGLLVCYSSVALTTGIPFGDPCTSWTGLCQSPHNAMEYSYSFCSYLPWFLVGSLDFTTSFNDAEWPLSWAELCFSPPDPLEETRCACCFPRTENPLLVGSGGDGTNWPSWSLCSPNSLKQTSGFSSGEKSSLFTFNDTGWKPPLCWAEPCLFPLSVLEEFCFGENPCLFCNPCAQPLTSNGSSLHSGEAYLLVSPEMPFLLQSLIVLAICLYIKFKHPLQDGAGEEYRPERVTTSASEPVQETSPAKPNSLLCVGLEHPPFLLCSTHQDHNSSEHVTPNAENDDTVFSTSYIPPNSVDQNGCLKSQREDGRLEILTKARSLTEDARLQREEMVVMKRVFPQGAVVVPSVQQPTANSWCYFALKEIFVHGNTEEEFTDEEKFCKRSTKITVDGHKANGFVGKLGFVKEPHPLAPLVSNPPPNTSGIYMPPPRNVSSVETSVVWMNGHGFGVHGGNVGPTFDDEDLEFIDAVQPLQEANDNVVDPFDCCFDHGYLQVFQAQYGV